MRHPIVARDHLAHLLRIAQEVSVLHIVVVLGCIHGVLLVILGLVLDRPIQHLHIQEGLWNKLLRCQLVVYGRLLLVLL